jgi:hypothetical protein
MSKHIRDNTKDGVIYTNLSGMVSDNTPVATQIHNHIAHQHVSKRKKLRITDCDQRNRRDKTKERLLKKLAERKAKKSN